MKKNWPLVIAVILIFFASVLLTMGTLITLDARKNRAPARIEPGLGHLACSLPGPLPYVRFPKQVVYRGVVKPRQANQDIRWDVPLASLIVAIDSLRAR